MIFDSTLLAALAHDIKQLRGERVRDVWQANASTADTQKTPDGNEGRAVYLVFRQATLLIDTHPQHARLHLVSDAPNPPSTPTALTGLLRKTLRGALLLDVNQWNFDRILHLKFEARNELGDLHFYTLVAEMMDRRSNLILLDGLGHDGIIMDAVKRLPPFLNRARTILPHRAYEPPPSQKRDPLAVSDWLTAISQLIEDGDSSANGTAKIESFRTFIDALRAGFCGVSPIAAQAIETKARELQNAPIGETPSAAPFDAMVVARACDWFFANAYRASRGDFKPVLCDDQPYPFALPGRDCTAASSSDMSTHVAGVVAKEVKPQQLQTERARLLSHLGHREKLVAAQQGDVEKALRHAREATTFNHWGQLLLAHIPLVEIAARRQQTSVDVPDDFAAPPESEDSTSDASSSDHANEAAQIEARDAENALAGAPRAGWARIPIEPKWTAPDNAAKLFERYRRARKLGDSAPNRQVELEREAQQLAAWRALALAAQNEEQLRIVAIESGLEALPEKDAPRQLSRSKQQELDARPENKLRHRDYEGWQLWIGRNALENQVLLSKVASPSDVWMHVRGMPSAHVLIKAQKGKTPPPRVLEEGARWVANASRAGGRNNVPDREGQGERVEIIYTQAKWVRAVKGTPGRVTLQRFETMNVRA